MAKQAETQEAARSRRFPSWEAMDRQEREALMQQILQAIAEWRPIPERLMQPLPTALLKKLLDAVNQLKAEGLAGPHNRANDRIKRLKSLLNQRGLGGEREPTADEVVNQQPPEVRNQILAQESALVKESEVRALQEMQKALARSNNPLVGV